MTEINLDASKEDIRLEIDNEVARSCRIHDPQFDSPLEALGVLTEEYYECVEAFRMSKDKYPEGNIKLRIELVQLAAMCQKAFFSVPDWDPEVFEKMVDEAHEENYSTMSALGSVTRSYHRILMIFVSSEISTVERMNMLRTALVKLYFSCLSSIMSCCVYQK